MIVVWQSWMICSRFRSGGRRCGSVSASSRGWSIGSIPDVFRCVTRRGCGRRSTASSGWRRTRRCCSRRGSKRPGRGRARGRGRRRSISRSWAARRRARRGGRWRRRATSTGCRGSRTRCGAGCSRSAQVEAIAPAAAADPSAEDRLVALAATTNVSELREECLRTTAAADPDPDATHRRIHAERRCCGRYTDGEGARNLAVRGTGGAGRADRSGAGADDRRPATSRPEPTVGAKPREAYAFDALVALAERDDDHPDQEAAHASRGIWRSAARRSRRVDPRRGRAASEMCEIVGRRVRCRCASRVSCWARRSSSS